MNKKKLIYAQPDCDLFVVRFEGGFLTGTNFGNNGTENGTPVTPGNGDGWGDGWDNN